MNVVKRICFEITFVVLLIALMPIHFIQAMFLLTVEVIKVYPPVIHDMVVRMFYGNNKEDS